MATLLLLVACGSVEVPLGGAPPADAPPTPVDADGDPPDAIVDCDGGGDHTTISAAIAAADDGDVIHVWPCTYDETIDFEGKQLSIRSTDGSGATFVTARSGAVVRAVLGEGTGTELVGFTLAGGGDNSEAAVNVDFAALRLEDVVLEDNRGWTTIYGASADIELDGVTLAGNRTSYGIAVYMSRGGLVATDVDIDCDGGSIGVHLGHGSGVLDRATIACGRGTAVQSEHAVGHVQRSVLEGGVSVLSEDDHYDDFINVVNSVVDGPIAAQYGSLVVRNSVVTGGISLVTVYLDTTIEGSVITGASCGVNADTNDFTIRNNIFFGNSQNVCGGLLTEPVGANDNLGVDPMFVDEAGGDYTLAPRSPGIDAGPDEEGYEDVDGSRNDIGVYGGPFSIGGGY